MKEKPKAMEDGMKVETEYDPRVKPKPETLTEFFISEYCALKEENARLKEEVEYWKVCTDRNIERYVTYRNALKALAIVMDGTDRISVQGNTVFFPTTKGYEELKKYLELQKRIDQNDDETD